MSDELVAAYMLACKDRAPDHNEIGLYYFRAAWKVARELALEEAAKACEGEHITFLAARAIRALIGKEQEGANEN